MKSLIALAFTLAASVTLLAADLPGKDEVQSAAQKLAAADNYSWTTTIESAQFRPGPSHGKTEKGGFTYVDFTLRDNKIEAVIKDGKGAIKSEEGWQTLEEAAKPGAAGDFNPRPFLARRMQNYKAPAVEAQDILAKTKDVTKSGDVYAGDMTAEGAKSLMTFGRRGGESVPISNAKGSVKFWTKDGMLTKYQFHVQGTLNRNGDEVDIDRTTTVEITDVGKTKVTVPAEAKGKLS